MPQGQVDLATLKSLADNFAADYCLTGTVLRYELATLSEEGSIPALELNMRWLDARRGRPIWSEHISGSGADLYQNLSMGNYPLARATFAAPARQIGDSMEQESWPAE